jgi:tRNA A-37 threonylcarbamoyl transferase component Bud32
LKVAAKMVFADEEAWVKEEIENERQSLEALSSLQGSVIAEKVFAGKINEGKDRLLVTKFVEGTRLDNFQMREEVAANARSALEEIHGKGYIHGDVVARNIVVQPSGKCVFVDLGRTRHAKSRKEKQTEMLELEAAIKARFRQATRPRGLRGL